MVETVTLHARLTVDDITEDGITGVIRDLDGSGTMHIRIPQELPQYDEICDNMNWQPLPIIEFVATGSYSIDEPDSFEFVPTSMDNLVVQYG